MHAISSCCSLITLTLSLSLRCSGFWFKIRDMSKQINPKNNFKRMKSNLSHRNSWECYNYKVFLKKKMVGDTGWKKFCFYLLNCKNGVFLCSDMLALELGMSKSYFKFLASTASKVSCNRQNFKIRFFWHIWSRLYKKLKHIGGRCEHIFYSLRKKNQCCCLWAQGKSN